MRQVRIIIVILLAVSLSPGSPTAQALDFAPYRQNFGDPRWQTKLNNFIDAVTGSINGLNTFVTGWLPMENQDILIPGCTYASATNFTVPGDFTLQFVASAKVRVDLGAEVLKASYVASSSYTGGTTTVILHDSILTNPLAGVWVTATRNGLYSCGNGEVNALDFAGGTPSLEGLQATISAIRTNNCTLRLPSGTWPITADLTIPANITLKLKPGAILSISTTKTLTINGPLEAGLYQIFSCTGTGKVLLTGGKIQEINARWWGDDRNAIQAAIDCYVAGTYMPKIKIPAGEWNIETCLNATNHWEIWIAGDASSASYEGGTVLRGNSGPSKAVIDCVGTRLRLENISLASSGAATPSTIGIIMGASNLYNPPTSCRGQPTFNLFSNVSINMESNINANNGLGTVALINDCAEETTYNRMYLRANLPLLITSDHSLSGINGHTFTVSSEYATLSPTYLHNGVHNFQGVGLIALDSYRPAAALGGMSFNLGSIFMASSPGGGVAGTYHKGILCRDVLGIRGHVEMENFETVFDLKGRFEDFDVDVEIAPLNGIDELITANTSDYICHGKCKIMVPNGKRDINRKYFSATVNPGSVWAGIIVDGEFVTNLDATLESSLLDETMAWGFQSGSLRWTNGYTEFSYTPGGGRCRKTWFGYPIGTFSSPSGLTVGSNPMFIITKPSTEVSGHKAGTVTGRMNGHITTSGGTAAAIASLPFSATFSIVEDAVGNLYLSDSDGVTPGAQADKTVGSAASSGGITLTLDQVILSFPAPYDTIQVVPIVTGAGANINGATCYVSGYAEFYLYGFETRLPKIDKIY